MKLLFSYYQCFLRVNLFKVATTWWAGLSIPDKFSLIFFNLFFTKGAEISGPRVPKLNFKAKQNETYAYETGTQFTCLLVQTYKYWPRHTPTRQVLSLLAYWYKRTNTDPAAGTQFTWFTGTKVQILTRHTPTRQWGLVWRKSTKRVPKHSTMHSVPKLQLVQHCQQLAQHCQQLVQHVSS
jgi:hypothetical protein